MLWLWSGSDNSLTGGHMCTCNTDDKNYTFLVPYTHEDKAFDKRDQSALDEGITVDYGVKT